jgi:hypothetical protein
MNRSKNEIFDGSRAGNSGYILQQEIKMPDKTIIILSGMSIVFY